MLRSLGHRWCGAQTRQLWLWSRQGPGDCGTISDREAPQQATTKLHLTSSRSTSSPASAHHSNPATPKHSPFPSPFSSLKDERQEFSLLTASVCR